MATRRWFYFIPRKGDPLKLVHRIEAGALDAVPGKKLEYSGWEELHKGLKKILSGAKVIAMQYSPDNNIPYIGLVDAGTIELIRKLKKKVVSSADLVQKFEASWSTAQFEGHLEAGRIIDAIVHEAFTRAAAFVRDGRPLTEFELQQWILEQFRLRGITTSEPPIVAVQPNNGNPHYEPTLKSAQPIRAGDLLMLDVWGKLTKPGSVYYDITWIGYLGARVPDSYAENIPHRESRAQRSGRAGEDRRREGQADSRLGSGSRRARPNPQGRLREIFRSPHRPQHRRGNSRQRREHGQP